MKNTKKYRIVECINIIWECEASSEKEAKDMYYEHVSDPKVFQSLSNEASCDCDVFDITDEE